tara:strand:- start:278 stop:391 length:114 start_codon:yes stop_codon:yes gene_type:complete
MERSYLKDSIKGIIQEALSVTLKDEKLFMKKNILLMK